MADAITEFEEILDIRTGSVNAKRACWSRSDNGRRRPAISLSADMDM
jgi:hypothetical protein